MRFSDLNKAKPEPARPEPVKKAPPPAPAPVKEKPAAAPRPAEQAPAAPPVIDREEAIRHKEPAYKLSPRREPKPAAKEPQTPFRELNTAAREVYARTLEQAGALLKGADQPYTEKYEAVLRTCDLVIETLKTSSVLLNYAAQATADDYLRAHSANTAIIALALGMASELEPSELRLLGFCAMAHDIGMTAYSELYSVEGRLTEEDFEKITMHTEAGVEKLDRIVDVDYKIKDRAKRIIFQTHERLDGTGYPDRLSSEEIDPLAQLIGIADVYEAMTHPRAWREALNAPDVIKELIEKEGRGFNSGAVKALISALSIYPPYSLVALSTGEIARVIKLNKGSLTRPLVEVLLDPAFAAAAPQMVDLMEYPLTSIERPVSPEEVRERNPKYAAKLELARWWVEW